MPSLSRLAPLALLLLPLLGRAQMPITKTVGLEIPASAPPKTGHFLTGAYVSGGYTPALATSSTGYTVQPYLRYLLGTGYRARPFVQYSFTPFRVQQEYGSTFSPVGLSGVELPSNPGFAPLLARNLPYPGTGYGGFGGPSVGIPVSVGRSSVLLELGGSALSGMFLNMLR